MKNIVVQITEKAHKPNEVIARILKKLRKEVEMQDARQYFTQLAQNEEQLAEMIANEKLIPTDAPEDFVDTMITLSAAIAFIGANSPAVRASLTKQLMKKEPTIAHSEKLKYNRALDTLINYKETLNNVKRNKVNPVEAEVAKSVFNKDTSEILENLLGKSEKLTYKQALNLNKIAPAPIIEAGDIAYIAQLQTDFEPTAEEEAPSGKPTRKADIEVSSRTQTDTQRVATRKQDAV